MPTKKSKSATKSDKPSGVAPLVGVVMGSKSDWDTMSHAVAILEDFGIPCEYRVVSAHRMPDAMANYAKEAETRGLHAIIAGAGGAAHLPGMIAAQTTVPVLGVPIKGRALGGIDSLLSIVQMPAGVPVATFAIGEAGAKNAALFAISQVALLHDGVAGRLKEFRAKQTQSAAESELEAPKKLSPRSRSAK